MVSQGLLLKFQRILRKEQVFLEEADRLTYAYDAAVDPHNILHPGKIIGEERCRA